MKRGDLVLVAVPGAFGKPRPALIVQSDLFAEHPSVTICLLSSHLQPTPLFRYTVEPLPENGLTVKSQVQVDKLMTLPRSKAGQKIGILTDQQMQEMTRLLALWIGIAG
ncbi:transcriptional modulator of MazE/toxin, MazF [Geoalkalibacter ferrihydriticus]|uniref:Growth inhibitor PemK n=2 Tax=Geoalkalibacter ferrihydriticus TaxID=392333 RepID=A0A0C2HEQ7_9BACT|nr:type II toxin-antitoxin system PemK/MazF family toxin [Geoalkalibacter ferrihydriticus]KIH75431.1 growth inhibitor PemK [Geoalkalibacter ferrihydriticus DSM 17813]SDM93047.1 transcriptional modulator of MazE/toxin, MazF [Geoalkalibacter ferrihydriticus]